MKTLCLAVAICAWLAAPAAADSYDNRNYRFSASLPDGATICRSELPGPNHGFTLLLDSSECAQQEHARRIEVYAAYNTAAEAASTAELCATVCDRGVGHPSGLRVDGVELYRCANDPGAEAITYLALRPEPDKWEGQWTAFQVTLRCEGAACDERVLSRFLAGMHFR